MAKLTGGKMLAQLNKENPNLGALLSRIIDSANHAAAQAGISPVGQNPAPPPPNAVDVTVTGEQAHIRVTDNNPTNRARTYFTEVHADPGFTQPLIVQQHGASRASQPITLPTFSTAGPMTPYYIQTYSQDPGSPPSAPVKYPVPVTMDGTTTGDVPASTGSGTASANGSQPAQGYGKTATRPATAPKRTV